MRIGAEISTMEMTDPGMLREFSQAVEALGYDHIVAYDHLFGANPESWPELPVPFTNISTMIEPLVLFSFLAGATTRIQFLTGVVILPQRQTILFAKQAGNLDLLSSGRLRLGLGTGWNQIEYVAQGVPFKERGRILDEQITLLRRLWTENSISFAGAYHDLDDGGMAPFPFQQPIPLWFGGNSDAAVDRAARLGAGWIPMAVKSDRAEQVVGTFRNKAKAAGRDPKSLGIEHSIMGARFPGARIQTIEECVAEAKIWESAGATHINLSTQNMGMTTIAQRIDFLAQFITAVSH